MDFIFIWFFLTDFKEFYGGSMMVVLTDLKKEKNEFIKSKFYRKYQDTYWSESILQDAFGQYIERHKIERIDSMTYEEIYALNMEVLNDYFADPFIRALSKKNPELMWKMQKAFYLDPDGASIRRINGIICTADGLISRKRISQHIKSIDDFVPEYAMARKYPIIHFPCEWDGINGLRAITFGDRIDHTLLDLKNYFDSTKRQNCKLNAAYEKPLTKAWLSRFSSFENLVDWLGVKGFLTNNNYEIYDLEKSDGSLLKQYKDEYSWEWSDDYYLNLRNIISNYNKNNGKRIIGK